MHNKNVKGSPIKFPSHIFHFQGQFQQMERDRRVKPLSDKIKRRQEEESDNGYPWGPDLDEPRSEVNRRQNEKHEAQGQQGREWIPMRRRWIFVELRCVLFVYCSELLECIVCICGFSSILLVKIKNLFDLNLFYCPHNKKALEKLQNINSHFVTPHSSICTFLNLR